ncbi:MAG: efflux RND transporter periplasmic adaptor subunit [Wenzhouxiangella sp.]
MKGYRLSVLALILLPALIFAITALADRSDQANHQTPEPARFVRVAPVQLDVIQQPLRLPGLLRATATAELAFLHAGHLVERRVRRGEQVSAGQVLALLHNPALSPALSASEARLREVQTELAQAERELQRVEDLHQRDLVSTEALERARARRSALAEASGQAEAQRREASEQLAEASLRAPFAGTVIDIHAETGEFVSAGQPILALAGNSSLEVALQVSAARAAALRLDQPVRVLQANNGASSEARVIEIGLASGGRAAPLRLALDAFPAHWQPGLGVTVELDFAQEPRLSVPLAAVIDPGGGQARVFVLRDLQVQRLPVQLGPVSAGRIVVTGELTAEDVVVVAGHGQLLDGETVRVLP